MGRVVDIEEGPEHVEEDDAADDDAPIACWLCCLPPYKKGFCVLMYFCLVMELGLAATRKLSEIQASAFQVRALHNDKQVSEHIGLSTLNQPDQALRHQVEDIISQHFPKTSSTTG